MPFREQCWGEIILCLFFEGYVCFVQFSDLNLLFPFYFVLSFQGFILNILWPLTLKLECFHRLFCQQINFNNRKLNNHATSIRYQSFVDDLLPVYSNTSTKKYIITHKEYRALRVICMPYLIHSSNTMISFFFRSIFLILQFVARKQSGNNEKSVFEAKFHIENERRKNGNTIKTRHYFNYAFCCWRRNTMSFWNASILMAFNYALLICVFRISNFFP